MALLSQRKQYKKNPNILFSCNKTADTINKENPAEKYLLAQS